MRFLRLLAALAFCLLLLAPAGKAQFGGSGMSTQQVIAALIARYGSLSSSGHTIVPTALAFPSVAVGGTDTVVSGIVDTSNGQPPGTGAWCDISSVTGTPLPTGLFFRCTVTASGTITVRAYPVLGLALGAQSMSVYLFWLW